MQIRLIDGARDVLIRRRRRRTETPENQPRNPARGGCVFAGRGGRRKKRGAIKSPAMKSQRGCCFGLVKRKPSLGFDFEILLFIGGTAALGRGHNVSHDDLRFIFLPSLVQAME